MSPAQMQRELEVLLLLGETLQAELVAEKKEHQETKKLLQDMMNRKGRQNISISVLAKEESNTPDLQHKLGELQSLMRYHDDDFTVEPAQLDSHDLRTTVVEMIGFTDYLIASVSSKDS